MVRSILPKLAWALSDALVINPSDQDLTPWHWVTAWAPVMPVHLMVNLLEVHFFPKWHDMLRAWVTHSPNYMEVEQWYLNWKVGLRHTSHPLTTTRHWCDCTEDRIQDHCTLLRMSTQEKDVSSGGKTLLTLFQGVLANTRGSGWVTKRMQLFSKSSDYQFTPCAH